MESLKLLDGYDQGAPIEVEDEVEEFIEHLEDLNS